MKYKNLERQDYELTCISPIHIGNGEILKPIDYVYDKRKQQIFFLNEGKWKAYLVQHQLLDEFFDYLRQARRSGNLFTWLQRHDVTIDDVKTMSSTVSRVETTNTQTTKDSVNDIHRLMTTSLGVPYIPGSSLKGCLRTGLLSYWIKQHPHKGIRHWNEAKSCRPRDKWAAQSLEKDAFMCLQANTQSDMVKSCMRGLMVSDAMCVEPHVDTVVLQKVDATTKKNKQGQREKTIPLFRECIPAGTTLRFSITFDKAMMGELGITSLRDVIKASQQFTKRTLAMQERIFGRDYKNEFAEASLADMLIGGGAGFQSKTVFYDLAPSFEEGRRILAQKLEIAFRKQKHYHVELDEQISPRTLKLTRTTNDRWIMGLCSLKEV